MVGETVEYYNMLIEVPEFCWKGSSRVGGWVSVGVSFRVLVTRWTSVDKLSRVLSFQSSVEVLVEC